ncbi:TonB-dependent siderophore receptor [Ottowia testudinis]|uniref:TonB-dependent siderophore receptor n=2 Tax=Ottowia testudinis TaxID=2816950 RepID=A0A975H7P8_9BURK|nr:TonB-dependent siderophore receptor [Ottowia testudinis]QTD47282.1 TonB-dependent siderophore receptor [Ottowia testudinis]
MASASTAQTAATETAPAEATLQEVNVKSQAVRETATTPVIGYRARRATTATKTDTPLAETPQSITVITRDQMTEQGMANLQDVLGYAAGVRSDAYGVDSRTDSVKVRGSNPDTYLNGLRDSFGYYTSTVRPDPYTLERIEVLRGPAGMLFGAGTAAGVVNLIGKQPQFEAQREIGLQLGSFNRKQAQFDLTGPINDQLAWRLVGLARKSGTQVDHVPDDRALLMPSLTWRPSAATQFTVDALWQSDKTGSTAQFFPWIGTVLPSTHGRLPTHRFIGEPSDRYDSERRHIGWRFEHAFNDQWRVRHNLRYSHNQNVGVYHWADFSTIVGGWGADPIGQRVIGRKLSDTNTKTRMLLLDQHLQGRFSTGALQHTVLAGIDHARQDEQTWRAVRRPSTIDAWSPVYGRITPGVARTRLPDTHQRNTGVYLQDQIHWQNWIFVAGLRHDRASSGVQGKPDAITSATTHRLGAMYTTPSGWNPYLSYAESFTPQAPRGSVSFKPLRGRLWELGLKYEPPGQALAFNAALYDVQEKNRIQSPQPDVYNQLGKTRTRGLELEARGAVGRHLDVLGHYNLTDADVQLSGVPKHQATAWGVYRFNASRSLGWSVGAGVRWMSAFRERTGPRVPATALVDLMLAYDTEHWRVALNVANAADKTYVSTCLSRGDCWWGARRTVLMSATYRF